MRLDVDIGNQVRPRFRKRGHPSVLWLYGRLQRGRPVNYVQARSVQAFSDTKTKSSSCPDMKSFTDVLAAGYEVDD